MAVMTTYTKRTVNPLDLRVTDICIEDIAHHLACINRFNGALPVPVTVAQHCVYVSLLLDGTGLELEGLLHDAAEAYFGDKIKWLKHSPEMQAFCRAEDNAQLVIHHVFDLPMRSMPPEIEWADRLMVRYESEFFDRMLATPADVASKYTPLTEEESSRVHGWWPWDWRQAEQHFLQRFHTLRGSHVTNR